MKVNKSRINKRGKDRIDLMVELRMVENDFGPSKNLSIIPIYLIDLLTNIIDHLFPPTLLNVMEQVIIQTLTLQLLLQLFLQVQTIFF